MPNITGLSNQYAQTSLSAHNHHVDKAGDYLAQISTGSRLSKASADSSSSAIVNTLKSNITVYEQSQINGQNASALIQVAVGTLTSQVDLLSQMKALSAQASGGDLDSSKRALINTNFQQLLQQVDSNATRARWNGSSLLLGGGGAVSTPAAAITATGNNIADGNNILAAGITGASSTGFISGSATSFSVTPNSVTAANFDISLVVTDPNGGKQTFQALNVVPTNTTALTLFSQSNNSNAITFTWGSAATGVTAANLKAALATSFGLGTGLAPVSFESASATLPATVSSIASGASTAAGTFALSYAANSNTIKLSQGVIEYTMPLTAGGAQAVTFANGVTANLAAGFALNTAVAQTVFTVGASTSSQLNFQLDLLATDVQTVQFSAATTSALGISGLDLLTSSNAQTATTALTGALQSVNSSYAQLGAALKRLEATITNLDTTIQNNKAAVTAYGDVDLTAALTEYVKENVMQQVSFKAISNALQMQQELGQFIKNNG